MAFKGIVYCHTQADYDNLQNKDANKLYLVEETGITYTYATEQWVQTNYQSKIDDSNKLNADYVNDASSTNKFVTASDKSTWNGKQDALTAGTGIDITNNVINVDTTTIATQTDLTSKLDVTKCTYQNNSTYRSNN